jgi:hypothetical protein
VSGVFASQRQIDSWRLSGAEANIIAAASARARAVNSRRQHAGQASRPINAMSLFQGYCGMNAGAERPAADLDVAV